MAFASSRVCTRVAARRVAFVLSAFLILVTFPAHAALSGRVEGAHLRVDGATPSSDIVVVSAIRETSRYRVVSMDRVVRALRSDATGVADYDYGRDIPVASIWAVVDQRSGAYAIVTPADYPRREREFTGTILKHATPAEAIDQLTTNGLIALMLLVRPGNGGGSWFANASDGAVNDDDREANGEVLTATTLFDSISGKEKGPKKLKKDDVLILIDPFEMTFSATTVVAR